MTDLPHPWNEFLAELDEQLKEPVDLHCIVRSHLVQTGAELH
jgi:hypothetical protein